MLQGPEKASEGKINGNSSVQTSDCSQPSQIADITTAIYQHCKKRKKRNQYCFNYSIYHLSAFDCVVSFSDPLFNTLLFLIDE